MVRQQAIDNRFEDRFLQIRGQEQHAVEAALDQSVLDAAFRRAAVTPIVVARAEGAVDVGEGTKSSGVVVEEARPVALLLSRLYG